MPLWIGLVLAALAGYLLGNISVGILIARAFGVSDIRSHGSGNAGSTNVLRTLGWVPSVLTLVGDCLKAFLAAKLGGWLAGDAGLLLGGFCAVLGHDYPFVFRFRGGKGVASSLGLVFAIDARIALIVLAVAVILTALTRYMSVGSLTASALFPVLTLLMLRARAHFMLYLIASIAVTGMIFFCHRANIARLIRGNENRLDFKKISKISAKLRLRRK